MKKPLWFCAVVACLLCIASVAALAQIFGPEGLNMPGQFNNWTNPPYINAFAGIEKAGGTLLVNTDLAVHRYTTTIHIDAAGADTSGGKYGWLFTSGPSGGYYNNK